MNDELFNDVKLLPLRLQRKIHRDLGLAQPDGDCAAQENENVNEMIGRFVASQYSIVAHLGSGGFGSVYKAWQKTSFQPVAIKLFGVGVRDGAQAQAEFKRELQSAVEVSRKMKRGVCSVLGGAESDHELGDQPYFVMRFVNGRSLLNHCNEERLLMNERIRLFIELCEVVDELHQHAGHSHGDLKPGNILYDFGRKEVVLIDLGLSRRLGLQKADTSLVGTLRYMAPEVLFPDSSSRREHNDVFSLGIILLELLSHGRLPPSLEADTTGSAVRVDVSPKLSTLVRAALGELDAIIDKARGPAQQRYGSAGEFAKRLKQYLNATPVWLPHGRILLEAGSRLGNYDLIRNLGSGTFGESWKAKRIGSEDEVVLKVPWGGVLPKYVENRYKRHEDRQVAGIVLYEEIHRQPAGSKEVEYLVRDYLSGQTLAERLAEAAPIKPAEALRIFTSVVQALSKAKEKGLSHRNLKPQNIVLGKQGDDVWLTDLGLTWTEVDVDAPCISPRAAAEAAGYFATNSDQAGNAAAGGDADVYAMGVLLFEMVYRFRPFGLETPAVTEFIPRYVVQLHHRCCAQPGIRACNMNELLAFMTEAGSFEEEFSLLIKGRFQGDRSASALREIASVNGRVGKWLEAARNEWPQALCLIGQCWQFGIGGMVRNRERAEEAYVKAARTNYAYANLFLGDLYRESAPGSASDPWEQYDKAARLGSSQAWIELAERSLSQGSIIEGVDQLKQSLEVLRSADKLHEPRGQYAAGFIEELQAKMPNGAADPAPSGAIEYYREAAKAGHRDSTFRLGRLLTRRGKETDKIEAITWLQRAAEWGFPEARLWLGCAHQACNEFDRAEVEYIRAAEEGAEAFRHLAEIAAIRGRPDDVVKWVKKAADRNDAKAHLLLGVFSYEGLHLKQDARAGAKRLHKAADASGELAKFAWFERVLALAKSDSREAEESCNKAAQAGHLDAIVACARLRLLKGKAKPVEELKQLLDARRAGHPGAYALSAHLHKLLGQKKMRSARERKAAEAGFRNDIGPLGQLFKGNDAIPALPRLRRPNSHKSHRAEVIDLVNSETEREDTISKWEQLAKKDCVRAMVALAERLEQSSIDVFRQTAAKMWYGRAKALGDSWGAFCLARLEARTLP